MYIILVSIVLSLQLLKPVLPVISPVYVVPLDPLDPDQIWSVWLHQHINKTTHFLKDFNANLLAVLQY